jgi:hypothetical protein
MVKAFLRRWSAAVLLVIHVTELNRTVLDTAESQEHMYYQRQVDQELSADGLWKIAILWRVRHLALNIGP